MDYYRIYHRLIMKALLEGKPRCYHEKHHILPKAWGGTDEPCNLVYLTPKQHRLAHILLALMEDADQWFAVQAIEKRHKKLKRRWTHRRYLRQSNALRHPRKGRLHPLQPQ